MDIKSRCSDLWTVCTRYPREIILMMHRWIWKRIDRIGFQMYEVGSRHMTVCFKDGTTVGGFDLSHLLGGRSVPWWNAILIFTDDWKEVCYDRCEIQEIVQSEPVNTPFYVDGVKTERKIILDKMYDTCCQHVEVTLRYGPPMRGFGDLYTSRADSDDGEDDSIWFFADDGGRMILYAYEIKDIVLLNDWKECPSFYTGPILDAKELLGEEFIVDESCFLLDE